MAVCADKLNIIRKMVVSLIFVSSSLKKAFILAKNEKIIGHKILGIFEKIPKN